eukprot:g1761.t1
MALRKRQRGHVESLNLINMMTTHQSKHNLDIVKARKAHELEGKPVIGRVTPLASPLLGGSEIIVEGTHFSGGDVYKCKFGQVPVAATYNAQGKGVIRCNVPPQETPSNVKFSIAIFSRDPTKVHHTASFTHEFRYYDPLEETPRIWSIEPAGGPLSGGTVVVAMGVHMIDRLSYSCKFGSEVVAAAFAHTKGNNYETVTCVSPPYYDAKAVSFNVLIAGIPLNFKKSNEGTSNDFSFTYYKVPTIDKVSPSTAFFIGGSLLQLHSKQWKRMKEEEMKLTFQCRFGGSVETKAYLDTSTSTIKCIVPPESSLPLSKGHWRLAAGGDVYMGHNQWTRLPVLLELGSEIGKAQRTHWNWNVKQNGGQVRKLEIPKSSALLFSEIMAETHQRHERRKRKRLRARGGAKYFTKFQSLQPNLTHLAKYEVPQHGNLGGGQTAGGGLLSSSVNHNTLLNNFPKSKLAIAQNSTLINDAEIVLSNAYQKFASTPLLDVPTFQSRFIVTIENDIQTVLRNITNWRSGNANMNSTLIVADTTSIGSVVYKERLTSLCRAVSFLTKKICDFFGREWTHSRVANTSHYACKTMGVLLEKLHCIAPKIGSKSKFQAGIHEIDTLDDNKTKRCLSESQHINEMMDRFNIQPGCVEEKKAKICIYRIDKTDHNPIIKLPKSILNQPNGNLSYDKDYLNTIDSSNAVQQVATNLEKKKKNLETIISSKQCTLLGTIPLSREKDESYFELSCGENDNPKSENILGQPGLYQLMLSNNGENKCNDNIPENICRGNSIEYKQSQCDARTLHLSIDQNCPPLVGEATKAEIVWKLPIRFSDKTKHKNDRLCIYNDRLVESFDIDEYGESGRVLLSPNIFFPGQNYTAQYEHDAFLGCNKGSKNIYNSISFRLCGTSPKIEFSMKCKRSINGTALSGILQWSLEKSTKNEIPLLKPNMNDVVCIWDCPMNNKNNCTVLQSVSAGPSGNGFVENEEFATKIRTSNFTTLNEKSNLIVQYQSHNLNRTKTENCTWESKHIWSKTQMDWCDEYPQVELFPISVYRSRQRTTRVSLSWIFNAPALRLSTQFDLICIYEIQSKDLEKQKNPDGDLLMNGDPVRWMDSHLVHDFIEKEIILSARYTPGQLYMARYEHRLNNTVGCSWVEPNLSWSSVNFTVEIPARQLFAGMPPMVVPVEFSLNAFDWHSSSNWNVTNPFKYVDPWWHNLYWAGDPRNAFSFSPSLGPDEGGTLITVAGLPWVPENEPETGYGCVFGDREVPAWIDIGDSMEALSEIENEMKQSKNSKKIQYKLTTEKRVKPVTLMCYSPNVTVVIGSEETYKTDFKVRIGDVIFGNAKNTIQVSNTTSADLKPKKFHSIGWTLPSNGTFIYYRPHQIEQVRPRSASCGDTIYIKTKQKLPELNAAITARFGTRSSSICTWDGTKGVEALRCIAPPLPSAYYSIEISLNNQQFSRSGKGIILHPPAHVFNVAQVRGSQAAETVVDVAIYIFQFTPMRGPLAGGTIVTVTGSGLGGGHVYKCRFGGKIVPAVYQSTDGISMPEATQHWHSEENNKDGKITCVSPPAQHAGPAAFSISLNGVDYSSTHACGQTFIYYPDPENITVYPDNGVAGGGSMIQISGVLPQLQLQCEHINLQCRFGTEAEEASIVTRALFDSHLSVLKCLVPPMLPIWNNSNGKVPVFFSLNGQNFHEVSNGFKYWQPGQHRTFLPQIGPLQGGTIVTIVGAALGVYAPSISPGKMWCHFGEQSVRAEVLTVMFGGAIRCKAPPSKFHYPSIVRFGFGTSRISHNNNNNGEHSFEFDHQPGNFRYHSELQPLAMSPPSGSERGGTEIHIRGQNMTSSIAYAVRLGPHKSRGIWDAGRGAVVVRSPHMPPGVWPVHISADEQHWIRVPGRFIVQYSDRIAMKPVAEPADLRMAEKNGAVDILYAPFPESDKETRTEPIITAVSIHIAGYDMVEMGRVTPADLYGKFTWIARIQTEDRKTLQVNAVHTRYHRLPILPIKVKAPEKEFHILDLEILVDNNDGHGWPWQRETDHEGGYLRWIPSKISAFRHGDVWNESGKITVRFLSETHDYNKNSPGYYSKRKEAIMAKTPIREKNNNEDQNLVSVSISLNGDKSSYTTEKNVYYTFDSRYEIGGVQSTVFRISPDTLKLAQQGMPWNTVARKLFDMRIIFDLSQSLGIARDRLVVTHVQPRSGIVTVECIPSRLLADPTCQDSFISFRNLIQKHGSSLYDGVLTWAIDPIFPSAGVFMIDGVPWVDGICSDPKYLTEKECMGIGECRCKNVTERDNREKCESSTGKSTQTYCQFLPENTWTKGVLHKVEYGHCKGCKECDTKEECLSAGTCSDPQYSTRAECLREGICEANPNDPEFDMSHFRTREECIDPSQRTNPSRNPPPGGLCKARPSATSSEAKFWYGQFTNRLSCEEPSKRKITPAPQKGSSSPLSSCGKCEQKKNGIVEVAPFLYSNFKTRAECEIPKARTVPVAGACRVKAPSDHLCVQQTGDNERMPAGFDCGQFRDRETCEKPSSRKKIACTNGGGRYSQRPTGGHCATNGTEIVWPQWTDGEYPDLRIQHDSNDAQKGKLQLGPPCIWRRRGPGDAYIRGPDRGRQEPGGYKSHDGADCGLGPPGQWTEDINKESCVKAKLPGTSELPMDGMGPPGVWVKAKAPPIDSNFDKHPGPPGNWISPRWHEPINKWVDGPADAPPCPCNWTKKRWHLTKCNWKVCGPPKHRLSSSGSVQRIVRQKTPEEFQSDYQAYINVGGMTMWMNLETGVGCSWVVSMVCFSLGCSQTKLFIGAFIPKIPPMFAIIDMFERGLIFEGTLMGFLGHTFMSIAGVPMIGAPIAMALFDLGQTLGENSFNHTGSVGLGFWEDNMINWLIINDPSMDVLTFMRVGNVFFPIPGTPAIIMKPFPLWGMPWLFPTGMVFKFAFAFNDGGGCFFLNYGQEAVMQVGGTTWIMAIPVAIKLVVPSWLFILSDVRVAGTSIRPCLLGICKSTVHTGQFHISGPMTPILKILEEAAAPKTCELLERLPDISFIISGRSFTMTRQQYVIEQEAFGELECLVAFTPVVSLIPGWDMWVLGDAWVHTFYTQFEVLPLRRVGFGVNDQRYYEKNGCNAGVGPGPHGNIKDMEEEKKDDEKQRGYWSFDKGLEVAVQDVTGKRLENWIADREGVKPMMSELHAEGKCGTGYRFREGSCITQQQMPQMNALRNYHKHREIDPEYIPESLGFKSWIDDREYNADGIPGNGGLKTATENVFGIKGAIGIQPETWLGKEIHSTKKTNERVMLSEKKNQNVSAFMSGGLFNESDPPNFNLNSPSMIEVENEEIIDHKNNDPSNDFYIGDDDEINVHNPLNTAFLQQNLRTESDKIIRAQGGSGELEDFMETGVNQPGRSLKDGHAFGGIDAVNAMNAFDLRSAATRSKPDLKDIPHPFEIRRPNEATMKEFHRRRLHKMRRERKFHESSIADRRIQGFHLDPDDKDDLRFIESEVYIRADEVKTHQHHVELMRNVTAVLKRMEPSLNVTAIQTRKWWRGESEDWIKMARIRHIREWEEKLLSARKLAASFKVKNMINKRVLRRVTARLTIDENQADEIFQEAQRQIDGGDGILNSYMRKEREKLNEEQEQPGAKPYDPVHFRGPGRKADGTNEFDIMATAELQIPREYFKNEVFPAGYLSNRNGRIEETKIKSVDEKNDGEKRIKKELRKEMDTKKSLESKAEKAVREAIDSMYRKDNNEGIDWGSEDWVEKKEKYEEQKSRKAQEHVAELRKKAEKEKERNAYLSFRAMPKIDPKTGEKLKVKKRKRLQWDVPPDWSTHQKNWEHLRSKGSMPILRIIRDPDSGEWIQEVYKPPPHLEPKTLRHHRLVASLPKPKPKPKPKVKKSILDDKNEISFLEMDRIPGDLPVEAYDEMSRKWLAFNGNLSGHLKQLNKKLRDVKTTYNLT